MDRLCAPAEDRNGDGTSPSMGTVLRAFLSSAASSLSLGARPLRVLRLLADCGVPERLGFHIYQCPHCPGRHAVPRSCGDRHCPRCLASKSRQWLAQQTRSLLPITYYHCVFTLPAELHALILLNPVQLHPLLFHSASQSLLAFGRQRLHGDLGLTAVLHTWGQQLNFHPHLHCIVTGGALSDDGQHWRSPKQRKFLFPVKALGVLFRGKFLDGLKKLAQTQGALTWPDARLADPAFRRDWFSQRYAQKWNVYAKRPFGGAQQVLSYLANYTHRVALSNRRLLSIDPSQKTVTFTWRDYRHGGRVQPLTLSAQEFIRRFSWHILPPGLVRIRHFGFLANNRRARDVQRARLVLARMGRRAAPVPQPKPPAPMLCPHCGQAGLQWIGYVDARGQTHFKTTVPRFDSS